MGFFSKDNGKGKKDGEIESIGNDGAQLGGVTLLPLDGLSPFQIASILSERGFDGVSVDDRGEIVVYKKGERPVRVRSVISVMRFEKLGNGKYRRKGGGIQMVGDPL